NFPFSKGCIPVVRNGVKTCRSTKVNSSVHAQRGRRKHGFPSVAKAPQPSSCTANFSNFRFSASRLLRSMPFVSFVACECLQLSDLSVCYTEPELSLRYGAMIALATPALLESAPAARVGLHGGNGKYQRSKEHGANRRT